MKHNCFKDMFYKTDIRIKVFNRDLHLSYDNLKKKIKKDFQTFKENIKIQAYGNLFKTTMDMNKRKNQLQ